MNIPEVHFLQNRSHKPLVLVSPILPHFLSDPGNQFIFHIMNMVTM